MCADTFFIIFWVWCVLVPFLAESGLKVGDRVLRVNDTDVVGASHSQVRLPSPLLMRSSCLNWICVPLAVFVVCVCVSVCLCVCVCVCVWSCLA